MFYNQQHDFSAMSGNRQYSTAVKLLNKQWFASCDKVSLTSKCTGIRKFKMIKMYFFEI